MGESSLLLGYPLCLQNQSHEKGYGSTSFSANLDTLNLDTIKITTWESLCTEEVINFLEKKHVEQPSINALAKILYKCRKEKDIGYARRAHNYVRENGLECHKFLGNYLIPMFVDCGSLVDAQDVFDRLVYRDEYAWSSLIHGYITSGDAQRVLNLYEQMQKNGVYPSAYTFLSLLKACIRVKNVEKGWELHSHIVNSGYESNQLVGNTLVDMYVKFGSLLEARCVLMRIPTRDVVSWTAMIAGYAEHGLDEEVLICLEQMKLENVSPDAALYVCSLKSFSNAGSVARGRHIHYEVIKVGYENDLLIQNILVDMYAKCGSLIDAWEVFQKMPSRSVISWTTLIAGHARCGECEMVFQLFEEMVDDGVRPNDTTFLILLSVCSHVGLVDKGSMYFNEMEREYGIKPSLKHYNCMLDLLSRAGQLNEAMIMVENLPLSPNLVTWKTILSACKKWGNVGIAKKTFEWALKMNEKHSSIFMLMSNIYTDANMWEDLKKVKELQAHLGLGENIEKSWIEEGNLVHRFVEGDLMYNRDDKIWLKVNQLPYNVKQRQPLNTESLPMDSLNNEDTHLSHCEEIAITFGLHNFSDKMPLRVVKNLWLHEKCHAFMARTSEVEHRTIICRDSFKFHVFRDGKCSCGAQ